MPVVPLRSSIRLAAPTVATAVAIATPATTADLDATLGRRPPAARDRAAGTSAFGQRFDVLRGYRIRAVPRTPG